MSTANSIEPEESQPSLSEHDAQRVLELLDASGEVHGDLWDVLTESAADRLVDELFRDEVHAQRA